MKASFFKSKRQLAELLEAANHTARRIARERDNLEGQLTEEFRRAEECRAALAVARECGCGVERDPDELCETRSMLLNNSDGGASEENCRKHTTELVQELLDRLADEERRFSLLEIYCGVVSIEAQGFSGLAIAHGHPGFSGHFELGCKLREDLGVDRQWEELLKVKALAAIGEGKGPVG